MSVNIRNILSSKVFSNYSHLTILQLVSVVISLTVYPFAIRALGAEVYGVYVYALTIMMYINVLVDFGLATPVVKRFIDCGGAAEQENRLVSAVVVFKAVIYTLLMILLGVVLVCVPMFRANLFVYLVIVLQVVAEIFSFQWVYHAKQKVHIVTYCNVICRAMSIPFILLCINKPDDLLLFASINTGALFLSTGCILVHLFKVEGIRLARVSVRDIRQLVADGLPFLSSDIIGSLRNEVAILLIGPYLGMREVAIYDLANKIVSIPRTFIMNVNKALYPDVLSTNKYDIRRLIRYEYLLGGLVIVGVVLCSYWAVLVLGGESMIKSYGVSIVLSVSILTWLVSGAYINFVFVPSHNYRVVMVKQVVSVVSFIILCVPMMYLFNDIYSFVISFVVSELVDMGYCHYISRKKKMLS